MEPSNQQTAIGDAIFIASDKIQVHRKEANKFLLLSIAVLVVFVGIQAWIFFQKQLAISEISKINTEIKASQRHTVRQMRSGMPYIDSADVKATMDSLQNTLKETSNNLNNVLVRADNTYIYILYGIFILVFGIVTSFYRYHLKEVSKYEHFLLGFHRIRIAGDHTKTGYEDEVKIALTKDAFTMEHKSILGKDKKVESPIPGHPTSDLSAAILSKLLEAVEITPKPKK
jgi:hypothetical protein